MRTTKSLLSCSSLAPSLALALAAAGAVVLAAPPAAHADEQDDLITELHRFTGSIEAAQADGDRAASRLERPASECDEVVERLARTGMKPDDVIEAYPPYPFKDARGKCNTYRQWKAAVDAAVVIADAASALAMTATITPGWGDASYATDFGAKASACTAAVDRALAGGVPASLAVRVRSNLGDVTKPLPELRSAVCAKLADWAKGFAGATNAAKQAAADKARARYASVGAGGDKLSWLVYYDPDGAGTTWYLPGCKAEDDPKKLAKATVLMRWTEDADGTQSIRRLQFKGNKLVKDTSRNFLTEAAARRGCK